MNKRCLIILKVLLIILCISGRQYVFASVELNYEELSLEQILRDYGNRTGLAFSYSSNTVSLGHKYTIVGRAENREEGVGLICAEAKLVYKFLGNMVVLKQKLKPAIKKRVPESVPVNKEEEIQEEDFVYILPNGWIPSYQGPEFPDFKMPKALEESPVDSELYNNGPKGLQWLNEEESFKGNQTAVLWNKNSQDHSGRELAILFNRSKGFVKGPQVALLGNIANGGYGTQVSLLTNLSRGMHKGNQVSLMCNFSGIDSGLRVQAAFFYNKNKGDTHAQVGSLNVNESDSEGQYGLVNINGGDSGKQFGLFNLNKGKVGRQFGLINAADTCDYRSIGLVNFIRKGYNRFEIAYASEFALNASLRFGHERLYTILGLAFDWTYLEEDIFDYKSWGGDRGALQIGFGGWLFSKGRYALMQELTLSRFILAGSGFEPKVMLFNYGLTNGISLGREKYASTLIVGIHLNVLSQDEQGSINIEHLNFTKKNRFSLGDRQFDFWPGLKLGFRF